MKRLKTLQGDQLGNCFCNLAVRSSWYRNSNVEFIARNSAFFENIFENTFWIESFLLQKWKHHVQGLFALVISRFSSCDVFDSGNKMAEILFNDMLRNEKDELQMNLMSCDALTIT